MGVSGMIITNALSLFCPDASLLSVDPYQDTQWGNIGRDNIRRAIKYSIGPHTPSHRWEKQTSKIFWEEQENRYDFVFIDGDHSFEGCLIDIRGAHRALKKGGVMVLDDVLHDGPRRAISQTLQGAFKRKYTMHPESIRTMSAYIKTG